jgi:hypothetical protein
MNASTKNGANKVANSIRDSGYKIPNSVRQTILRTAGAQAQIAVSTGCTKQYVSAVLAGRKSCSERLWEAILVWITDVRVAELDEATRDMAWQEAAAYIKQKIAERRGQ